MKSSESPSDIPSSITAAVSLIRSSTYLTAFTGAGISVESGIPPFRGPGGLWGKYDPDTLQIEYFLADPARAWPTIKEIFYDNFGKAQPNAAHRVLARLEVEGWPREEGAAQATDGAGAGAADSSATPRAHGGTGVTNGASGERSAVVERAGAAPGGPDSDAAAAAATRGHLQMLITQNIDNLHYIAGNRNIAEFHGNSRLLLCLSCRERVETTPALLKTLPPRCRCGGVYKPDFIFFGEGIPREAHARSQEAASRTDVMLVVGSTGEVYPAVMVPQSAHESGAKIIEINPEESAFTASITDIHIPMKAGEAFALIEKELFT